MVASNGKTLPALTVFSTTLRYFRDHALRELTDATGRSKVDVDDVRWVITVPAIWRQQSKQFMREAAYMVSFKTPYSPRPMTISPLSL